MKVISILQPWASLLVLGLKRIETRSWNTKYRGEILIHASAKWSKDQVKICMQQPFLKCLLDSGLWEANVLDFDIVGYNNHLPTGAIIGKADLIGTCATKSIRHMAALDLDGVNWDTEIHFGDYSDGRYGWLMKDAFQFPDPVPAKGKLGIWEYPDIEKVIVLDVNDPDLNTPE